MLQLAERGKINHPIIMVFFFCYFISSLPWCQLYLRYPARPPSYPAAVALRRSAVTPGSSAAEFHGSHVFADGADGADQVLVQLDGGSLLLQQSICGASEELSERSPACRDDGQRSSPTHEWINTTSWERQHLFAIFEGFFCQSLSVCITSFLMEYLGSGVMETQLMLLLGTVWFVKLFCFM